MKVILAMLVLLSPLNTAVNALLQAAGAPNTSATRIVPIVTASGATAGYAQILGTRSGVDATKAVLLIRTGSAGAVIDALVPVTKIGATDASIRRANGVGIDALIDYSP